VINIALADGSVRTLAYTVDRTTFKYLGSKADGQPIDLSGY